MVYLHALQVTKLLSFLHANATSTFVFGMFDNYTPIFLIVGFGLFDGASMNFVSAGKKES